MVARAHTVTFRGVDVLDIDVQVQVSNGLPAFHIVGLADKAVSESKERVKSALHALGLSLPTKRVTVNLAPADVTKEGSHFDLPIALGVLAVMDIIPKEELDEYSVVGELALDGQITPVSGVLAAAINASASGRSMICPKACGAEAKWADIDVLAPAHLLELINHFKGTQVIAPPEARVSDDAAIKYLDLVDVKGQESAKRALEVAAAGGHNMLMSGPPGSGKSMLAARMPGILPPLSPREALDVSMIHSIAGDLEDGALLRARPYRDPHHSASLPAMIGGGQRAKPGEISLAHHGVLFLDELPEFSRQTLEALRQPLETGHALVSRVNYQVRFPANFQLIAAMNPCRCGYLGDVDSVCSCTPKSVQNYQGKISGPLFDRIDIHIDVPAVSPLSLASVPAGETSEIVAKRVQIARDIQAARFANMGAEGILTNASADGDILEKIAPLSDAARNILVMATERMKLSARGYHRVLRVARTLADLDGQTDISPDHVAEAVGFRRMRPGQSLAA